MLQYRFDMTKILDVPADAFNPPPEVESAVLRLKPLRPLPHIARDEALLGRIVAAAFSQRRKTLRNSLRGLVTQADFAAFMIEPSARAQDVSVERFVAIANYLSSRDFKVTGAE
jgi:16S rRNA (adenine1518-N6/adenine1519-N6)-dimethyltransferase